MFSTVEDVMRIPTNQITGFKNLYLKFFHNGGTGEGKGSLAKKIG